MRGPFYRDSPHAVTATKPEMLKHAEEIRSIISGSNADVELIAVNKLYKWSFVGKTGGKLHVFLALPHQKQIRREYEFNGRGQDAWETAPNYVQLKDLVIGQLELF
ncbi:hypothetical protein P4H66_06310 [Paenibacillus dokdonensis]|uniref:Uncharacterized protein n=1 Tax=Paenibacillus dokdonensis TaxID=2567944 RepID=A0ABU6GJT9_9BACL|nr:hypothetical protein [Paenibacillus dokdonensis]MEC0239468.1 hypothetical protein [Paenibacillus dokdonensis]